MDGGSHQVWCINRSGGKPPVAIPNAERRAFGFMIHALMLAVNNNNMEAALRGPDGNL